MVISTKCSARMFRRAATTGLPRCDQGARPATYRRIHGELLVLGVKFAASTVWEILRARFRCGYSGVLKVRRGLRTAGPPRSSQPSMPLIAAQRIMYSDTSGSVS